MIPLRAYVDLSVKKTWWKMSQSDQDPSIPCGRIRIRTERSELNESLQLKDTRHSYSPSGNTMRQDSNFLKRNTAQYVDLSAKKTLWEMGYIRIESGSIHSMLEDPATAKSSGLNER
jgi:hypothetical protein